MDEFEKWQKKALKHEYSPNVYRGAEKGWKAALEWALKSGYIDDYGDDIINSWDIEEELDEKT